MAIISTFPHSSGHHKPQAGCIVKHCSCHVSLVLKGTCNHAVVLHSTGTFSFSLNNVVPRVPTEQVLSLTQPQSETITTKPKVSLAFVILPWGNMSHSFISPSNSQLFQASLCSQPSPTSALVLHSLRPKICPQGSVNKVLFCVHLVYYQCIPECALI